jgi:hypothetical protein
VVVDDRPELFRCFLPSRLHLRIQHRSIVEAEGLRVRLELAKTNDNLLRRNVSVAKLLLDILFDLIKPPDFVVLDCLGVFFELFLSLNIHFLHFAREYLG